MKYLNKTEIIQKGYNNADLRNMLNKRLGELNARLPNNEQLMQESSYLLGNNASINNGKMKMSKPVSEMNRQELIENFNDLTQAIKQDTSSPYYHANTTAMDKQLLKKVNKAFREQHATPLNMEQFQEVIKIRDEFGEIFDKSDIYELTKNVKKLRRGHQKPLIDLIRETKNELEESGRSWDKTTLLQTAMEKSNLWEFQSQSRDPQTGLLLEKPKGW